MGQEIVQEVGYRFTDRAKGYISEELGYDFEKSDPLDVIHTITWLKANDHPLELKLEMESLRKEGPVNYIIDMLDIAEGIESAGNDYLFPNKKICFKSMEKISLEKANRMMKISPETDEAWESAEISVGFDEPGLGTPTKTVSFISKLPVKGLAANQYTNSTGSPDLGKPKRRF